MDKVCGTCKELKPSTEFAKNKAKRDGLQGMCRACKKLTDAKHYKQNKDLQLARNRALRKLRWEYVSSKKTGPCVDCKQTFIPFAMDFDHVRGTKTMDVSIMCSNAMPFELIDAEIAKCDLVCATCHRIRTHNRKMGP